MRYRSDLMPDELAPDSCPFCGSDDTGRSFTKERHGLLGAKGVTLTAFAICHSCGAKGPAVSKWVQHDFDNEGLSTLDQLKNEAVERWNRLLKEG